jgi:hypothetical protein
LTLLNGSCVPQLFFTLGKKMRNQKLKTTLLSTVALLAVALAATSIGPVIAGQENDEKADKDAARSSMRPRSWPIRLSGRRMSRTPLI